MSTNLSVELAVRPSLSDPNHVSLASSAVLAKVITYEQVIEEYLEEQKLDGQGNLRPAQVLKNKRSHVKSWLEWQNLTPSSPVGEELGIHFNTSKIAFLDHLEGEGKCSQTRQDRKSTVLGLHYMHIELMHTSGLPVSFAAALNVLFQESGMSLTALAKRVGVSWQTLNDWVNDNHVPRPISVPSIHNLEDSFKLSRGTLTSRLPDALWMATGFQSGTTAWRRHIAEINKLPYFLKCYLPAMQEEWEELYLFYTDVRWADEHGLERNSSWRIRKNSGDCPTAGIRDLYLRSFFGYLLLPSMHSDKRLQGKGFGPETLTLAMVSDFNLVKSYLYFKKDRSATGAFNSATKNMLAFLLQLLRPDTGYLWQRPEFGQKLPDPIPAHEWHDWCDSNRVKLKKFTNKIASSERDGFTMTRDPFEPVRDIIENLQHPICILMDVADRMESLIPILEKWSAEILAIHMRNLFLIRFIASNPLRIKNFAMMTFIPRNFELFEKMSDKYLESDSYRQLVREGKVYIETDSASNLFQKSDGTWWLRFEEDDFKNPKGRYIERGILRSPYCVPVVPSVWPALADYLFRHRGIINQTNMRKINLLRRQHSLPDLNSREELAIARCRYVFRQDLRYVKMLSPQDLAKHDGIEQISSRVLSRGILHLTQRYIPGCPGFSAHACRHLVASEYLKNEPNGEAVAAEALHNTVDMIKKHYAWVTKADRIKPWNDYFESLHQRHRKGEA